jgi:F-type H+-transporting ATPase subunit c
MRKTWLFVMLGIVLLAVAGPALAQEHGATQAATSPVLRDVFKFIAAAFAIGLAAFGGAFGQGKAVAAACTSMGRNPGAAGPVRITMIVGVAFIESLVIYGLLIAFIILGK